MSHHTVTQSIAERWRLTRCSCPPRLRGPAKLGWRLQVWAPHGTCQAARSASKQARKRRTSWAWVAPHDGVAPSQRAQHVLVLDHPSPHHRVGEIEDLSGWYWWLVAKGRSD
jgi:hypothetical protein